MLKPVAGPQRPSFKRGNDVFRKAGRATAERQKIARADARKSPANKPSVGRDERCVDLVAESLPQRGTQIAERIDQAEIESATSGPVFAGEQHIVAAIELAVAARFHQRILLVVVFVVKFF